MVDLINRVISSGRSDDASALVRAYMVRYLPSGDWKIIFDTEEAWKFAEINTGWVKRAFT